MKMKILFINPFFENLWEKSIKTKILFYSFENSKPLGETENSMYFLKKEK